MLNNEASTGHWRTTIRIHFGRVLAALLVFMASADSAAANQVRIAVVGPFAGPRALETLRIHEGAHAAIEVLSKPQLAQSFEGPFDPGPYQLNLKNDFCNAAFAVVVAKQIVSEGYDLVLGHPCPKAALAVAKVYGPAGVTFIATETRHPELTAKRAGSSIFRLCGRDNAQGLDAARYLAATHKSKPVAVVNDRTLYSEAIADQAIAALKDKKIETITATIVSGDKEYGKLVTKIKDADAVFFAGFPMEAGFIVKELRAAGSTAPFLATESVGTSELAASFGDAIKDIRVLVPDRNSEASQDLSGISAVRLYARAKATAMGPTRTPAERRALINATLNRHPGGVTFDGKVMFIPGVTGIKDLNAITFDAAGNANTNSYRLLRFDGMTWQGVSALTEPKL